MATKQAIFDFAAAAETYSFDLRCLTDSKDCYLPRNDSSSDVKQKDCIDIKPHKKNWLINVALVADKKVFQQGKFWKLQHPV